MNEKELTHIDLFSGIGGFALAAKWAGFKTIAFCEKEEFCQKVLKKRFGAIIADPKSMGWRNGITENKRKKPRKINSFSNQAPLLIPEIRDFDGTKYRNATLLTGGFPCQPFSVAGPRKGTKDDRYLWPEMLRVINEAKPRWILGENVAGIRSVVFNDSIPEMEGETDDEKSEIKEYSVVLEAICSDLEGIGYSVQPVIIPACGLNAPHRRDRVWIIANSGCQYGERTENKGESKRQISEKENASMPERPTKNDELRDASDTKSRMPREQTEQERGEGSGGRNIKDVANTDPGRARRHESKGIKEGPTSCGFWQEDWYEVATRFCRMDDGVSDRIHRLKALGNAIVPQIAYEILKNIAWIEKESSE